MSKKFPHLDSNSEFPLLNNVDVYKYDNNIDYKRFDATQMSLQMCSVPWDMGEVHIGNRTYSGIGNVVKFRDKAARDKYFDDMKETECYRFDTKFKELHRDHIIDVPIPFDMACLHNYLVVKYNKVANDISPLQYEGEDGIRKWFWFIREVEFVAPNTTRLHLLEDAWQTWIYDVNISNMVLERGHAPMFATKTDDYLQNPIENNQYLLCEDVNFGEISQVKNSDNFVINDGDMLAVIATIGDPRANWGDKDNPESESAPWRTPSYSYFLQQGIPAPSTFAMTASNLNNFLHNVTLQIPQFKQTVKGIFFVSEKLVTKSLSFTFGGVECWRLEANPVQFNLTNLTKAKFGYDSKYADIAKLYTMPYAAIEITDEDGNSNLIKIEDTNGTLDISLTASLAFPFINIESHLLGVGGVGRKNITFKNVTSRNFKFGGRWYDTVKSWNIPSFAVVLDANYKKDYDSYFDRKQQNTALTNTYNNAIDTNTLTKNNADDLTLLNYDNTSDSINLTYTLSGYNMNVLNSSFVESRRNINRIFEITKKSNKDNATVQKRFNIETVNIDNTQTEDTAGAEIAADQAQAALNAQGGLVGGVTRAVEAGNGITALNSIGGEIIKLATGFDIGGAVGDVISSAANTSYGIISPTMTQTNATVQATETVKTAVINANHARTEAANRKIDEDLKTLYEGNAWEEQSKDEQILNIKNIKDINKDNIDNSRESTKETSDDIAIRTRDAYKDTDGNGINKRTQTVNNRIASRNQNTSQSAINNYLCQRRLDAPSEYGIYSDGDNAITKPMALFANIVTQPKGAIESAGDEFLRYGYTFNRNWQFDGNWCIGKHFTYWKVSDFWVRDLQVPDMYMDRLRFFLLGGVTIWSDPSKIGKVSIYDNF